MTDAHAPIGAHLLPGSAGRDARGGLSIGGVGLGELAAEYGTPLFVYDEDELRARCREALEAFGPGVAYATKAFLCVAMARIALEEGLLLDVSTGGELAVCLAAGAAGERLVFHGNNKSESELAEALRIGIGRIVVDSFDEIARLGRLTRGRGGRQRVLLRVTPGVEAHTHEYVRTGQEDSKFGFSLSSGAAEQAVADLRKLDGVEIVGLHAHIGSQIERLEAFEQEVEAIAPLLLAEGLTELCVGGGFAVAYVNDEHSQSISDWAGAVSAAARRTGITGSVRISAEPGRAIVARAGVTCYAIGTIKRLPGIRTYVAVDGGMSDNPRPVLYGSGYEAFLARSPDALRPLDARVVGKHCESGDILVHEAHLPEDVAVGDLLVTPVTGAYGFSMASNYNRVPRPPVVFVRDGAARLVVRRETVDDLLRLEQGAG